MTAVDKYPMAMRILLSLAPDAVAEHRFHPVRKWRFDMAVPSRMIAIEIDGGVWSGGRHSGGAGQIKDFEKGNAAAVLGWRVLHYTPQQIKKGEWVEQVRQILGVPE